MFMVFRKIFLLFLPVINGWGVVKTRHGGRLVHAWTRGHRLLGSNLCVEIYL